MRPLVLALIALLPAIGWSHPVTFKGGVAASSIHRPGMTQSHVNYTVHRQFALGATHLQLREPEQPVVAHYGQLNALLYRKNRPASQTNLYLSLGAGAAKQETESYRPSILASLQADHETDNFYSAFRAMGFIDTQDFDTLLGDPLSSESSFFALQGRVGILPFETDFESLQIWTVLQVDAQSWSDSPVELTPLLRLFYKNVLWEMGSSMSGKTWLHMMVHL